MKSKGLDFLVKAYNKRLDNVETKQEKVQKVRVSRSKVARKT